MAVTQGAIFEIRTTGSDSACSGAYDPLYTGGTDYSQQNAAQYTYTDLVLGVGGTSATSVAHPFGADAVGNALNVTGGTGFTAGFYIVTAVNTSTHVATLNTSAGSAASTGGTGNLGGALASPGYAAAQMVSGNKAWLKAGAYSITSASSNVSGGLCSLPNGSDGGPTTDLVGYNAARGDFGTPPVVTLNANASTQVFAAQDGSIQNVSIDANGYACQTVNATDGLAFKVLSQGVGSATFNMFNNAISAGNVISCSVIATAYLFNTTAFLGRCIDCFYDGQGHSNTQGFANAISCIAQNATDGFSGNYGQGSFTNCVAKGCTNGFTFVGGQGRSVTFVNCFAEDCTTGFNQPGSGIWNGPLINCGGHGNTNDTNGIFEFNFNFVSCSVSPFTNSAAGDYTLNSSATGGALLKGAGYLSIPGLSPSVPGLPSIGAYQAAGGGGAPFKIIGSELVG